MREDISNIIDSLSEEDKKFLAYNLKSKTMPNALIPKSIYMYNLNDIYKAPVELLISMDKRFVELDYADIGSKSYLLPVFVERIGDKPQYKKAWYTYYPKDNYRDNYVIPLDCIDRKFPYIRDQWYCCFTMDTENGNEIIFSTEEYTPSELKEIIQNNRGFTLCENAYYFNN